MYIKNLKLSNFRNYNNLYIDFEKGINIIYGDNAQGKTNILEAIYVCGTTKSHRGSKDKEIIKMGEKEAHIKLLLERENVVHSIDMHLKNNKQKGVAINSIPTRKTSDLFGIINIIFFSPEDLNIIKNGPAERRKFINFELCQLDKVYLYNLTKYNKILVQRNNLLRQISFNSKLLDTLSIWDEQLIKYGKEIIKARENFINQLNEIVFEIHNKLSGGKEKFIIKYEPNVSKDDFEKKLKKSREKELRMQTTSIGRHRDDMVFFDGNIDIKKFGSQGQQRTFALSLKLAEIELVKKIIKDKPILLLDDVLSELDNKRKKYLLDSIDGIQTIITCTGLDEFINSDIKFDKTYKVEKSSIIKQ